MASSTSSSSTPLRPAAASANPSSCRDPFHNAEESLAETRDDLRAVARKLSSCENALEGRGAYLGITDPVREAECWKKENFRMLAACFWNNRVVGCGCFFSFFLLYLFCLFFFLVVIDVVDCSAFGRRSESVRVAGWVGQY